MSSEFTLGLPRGGSWEGRFLGAWLDSSAVLAHDGCILYFFGAVGTRLHDVVLTVCASARSRGRPRSPLHLAAPDSVRPVHAACPNRTASSGHGIGFHARQIIL